MLLLQKLHWWRTRDTDRPEEVRCSLFANNANEQSGGDGIKSKARGLTFENQTTLIGVIYRTVRTHVFLFE